MSDEAELVRAGDARVMSTRGALTLFGRDGRVQRLDGDSAALADAVLAYCGRPRTKDAIRAHVEALSGSSLEGSPVLDALLALLRGASVLVPASPVAAPPVGGPRVIVAMGGAVAAAHAPIVVQALLARGMDVRVVASERALRFVSRETLEALTHAPVLSSMWPPEGATTHVPHVELAAWADAVLVWPASATMIARIAAGDCSELVSALAITTRAPVLIAPSMNDAMLEAPAVARNLETLRGDRFHVVGTVAAHEVAEAPGQRTAMTGGAPDGPTLASMIGLLARTTVPSPRDAASWEAFHRRVPESAQPWVTTEADEGVLQTLAAHAAPGAWVWDVGTGHGAIAIAAARRGHRVIASDVSATAIARAKARAGEAPIVWLHDDVTQSALETIVDVVVDRGTLHVLPVEARGAYVARMKACTRAGSVVILVAHAEADPRVSSRPMSEADVRATFGEAFEVVAVTHGVFAGTLAPAPKATTFVLRRRGVP